MAFFLTVLLSQSHKKTAKNEIDLFFFLQKTGNRETLVLKTGKPDLSYPLILMQPMLTDLIFCEWPGFRKSGQLTR